MAYVGNRSRDLQNTQGGAGSNINLVPAGAMFSASDPSGANANDYRPLHGYGILLRIGQISRQALLIEQGALYPALLRLVRQGLLKTEWGKSENNRRAKFYELTSKGRKRLREETDGWNRLAAAIASALATRPQAI